MDDLNTNSVGADQGGTPNLEQDLEQLGIESEEETVDTPEPTEDKDPEQLRQERATAVTEAIKHSKEAKSARADVEYYKAYAQVADDPNALLKVREQDSELAERITQEKWGVSYDELIERVEQENSPKKKAQYSEADIDRIIEQKLEQRTQSTQKQKIDDYMTDFFIDNDVDVKSPTFKNIMEELDTYQPKSLKQAEKLLSMIYKDHTGRNSVSVGNIDSVSMPRSSGRKTYSKSDSFKKAANLAKTIGFSDLTEADFKKYGA
tara:strand:+ start:955 stop:1743 length:789 start_codon:yes stop_codon:yes gene_type:complete